MTAIISSTAGTRVEPIDSYVFVRGTTNKFKLIFTNEGVPVKVDTGTKPLARILEPSFLNRSGSTVPLSIAEIEGELVTGQDYEYEFEWDIPADITPLDNYIVSYSGVLGGITYDFFDEYFTIAASAGVVGGKYPSYATVDDVRSMKFNIDDYLPKLYANDLSARNNLIEKHLRSATVKLREELSLFKQRGNSENYKLFCVYYTIWSILLASRGEDGSSVSDQNLMFWKGEWQQILNQEKREGVMQGVPLGRG